MLRTLARLGGTVPEIKRIQDRLLINNKFVPAVSGRTFAVVNPATEETIAQVAEAGKEDVDLAVAAARAAFKEFRLTNGSLRRDLLLKLADLVHAHREELAALESLDNGKPYKCALHGDLAFVVHCIRLYAGFADKVYGSSPPVSGNFLSVVRRHPVGVCGQIIPWNFPLLMATFKLAPALATGNTVVLKPAEQTPLSALRLGELCVEAGFPPGVVNILPGFGPTAGAAIASHMDVDKAAFTGSTAVGREVMRMAAESNLKKVSLELGGKSPLIICADADLDVALAASNMGVFFNAGQVCMASSRLYVHESLYDIFVDRLKQLAVSQRLGPGNDLSCNMGPLVSQQQLERVLHYIELGRREGAVVQTGGARATMKGYFIQPTVFTDVRDDMRICQEEIFGPVVCVFKFKDMEEAVQRANASKYGLAAGICTRSLDTALRYSTFLEAGTVWVNTWAIVDPSQPFGGFKHSGLGRELGEHGLNLYTETKAMMFALDGPIVKN